MYRAGRQGVLSVPDPLRREPPVIRSPHHFAARCLCLLVALAVPAGAVSPGAPPGGRFSEGLFWEILKDGETIGHIFGTFHSNDERVVDVPPIVRDTLVSSYSFSMEAFPGARYFNPHWGFRNVIDDMTLPRGQTLSDLVGDEVYTRIEKLLKENGVKPERAARLKPWAAMNELSMRKSRADKKRGDIMDHVLYELAAKHVTDLYQVETLEELLAAYYDFPLDAQIGLLNDRLDAYTSLPGIAEMMTEAYLREDLSGMLNLSTRFVSRDSIAKGYDRVYLKHVLHIRNIVMAHYMLAPLRRKNAFIAIGALHLHGEKGVLKLLEDYGYTLRRVAIRSGKPGS